MFTVASVVLHLVTAMPVALLLNERIPWKTAFRVIALIPWMFPVVVVGVLWAWLYHPQFGLFNDVALRLGLVRDTGALAGRSGLRDARDHPRQPLARVCPSSC